MEEAGQTGLLFSRTRKQQAAFLNHIMGWEGFKHLITKQKRE